MQSVEVTGDRTTTAQQISAKVPGSSADDVAPTPFLLIGSYEQMAAQILTQAEELGITSYVVREKSVPALERVLALIKR